MAVNANTTIPSRVKANHVMDTDTDFVIPDSEKYAFIFIQITNLGAIASKAQIKIHPSAAELSDLSVLDTQMYSGDLANNGVMVINLPSALPGGININFGADPSNANVSVYMAQSVHNLTRR